MIISPELQSKITMWRLKSDAGTITLEEMREAIKVMRQDRLNAGKAPSGARKAKTPTKSGEDLLSELGGLG